MVRTRHSLGDVEVIESPKFMSLNNERGKYNVVGDHSATSSPHSKSAYQDDDDFNIFEDKMTESRLRPRTGPRRAYNYLDADSSDDDQARRHKRYTPINTRSLKRELLEESGSDTKVCSNRISDSQASVPDTDSQLRRSRRRIIAPQPFEGEVMGRRGRQRHDMDMKEGEEDSDDDDDDDDTKDQDSNEDAKDQEDSDDNANVYSDLYSRVKRKRVRRQRHLYDDEVNTNNNRGDDSDEEQASSTRRSARNRKKPPEVVKSYSLREHKPRTDLYKAPVEERRVKKTTTSMFEVTPTKMTSRQPYQSPAQRRKTKKRSAMHSSSSSTSSSSGESSDEKSFKKRKAKSMAKARSRMMPMNLASEPIAGVIKDRVKAGASLADVEPMNIDRNITFDSIGGLGKHIRALKEMVVFPLLYDKVFQRFNVDPPRGVLFYGPPGTGKTLVARALANECSQGGKRVAFFMRKGADCLSKWVGESERQLRLLFDQAYKYRPSIIFFDEIDGLAPVRSSRQDQIHSSIVSTLLALMDGLDSRGEIVVIGATNRIDSLDPALRRPGRFDREFLFPLPALEARKQILTIQTAEWNPKLNEQFITELAEKTVGYCGADLKSLCTEAAMFALRRRYPQIYVSNEALQLDVSSINVCAKDFFNAINNIIPTSRRSVNTPGRPLSLHIRPLLERQLAKAVSQLGETFPSCLMKNNHFDAAATTKQAQGQLEAEIQLEDLDSDEDEDAPSIFISPASKGPRSHVKRSLVDPMSSKQLTNFLNFSSFSTYKPATFRPRVLFTGNAGQGQTSHLAPALIHQMEDLPVHVLDLPALYAVTAKTPEESCANVFHEARRKCPSIIYMPYINQWWDVLGDTLRTTLLTLIQDLNPTTPILLLATSEQPYMHLDNQLQFLFNEMSGEVMKMTNPNAEERKTFFTDLLLQHSTKLPPQKKSAEQLIKLMEKNQKSHFLSFNVNNPQKNYISRFTKIKEKGISSFDYKFNNHRQKNYKSNHSMNLRSSRAVKGCNNNNHSEEHWKLTNVCYKNLNRSCNIQTNKNYMETVTTSRIKFNLMTSNLLRKTSSKNCCIDRNFSNNQSSDRHSRYLNRLQKQHSMRGHCSVDFSNSRDCLSSGSVQMLYRKHEDSLYSKSMVSLLPINLAQLRRKPLRYNTRTQAKIRSSHIDSCRKFYKTKRLLEKLPKAAPTTPRELTKHEMDTLLEKEELTLMELRIFLRDCLHKLGSDKKFSIFTKPVNLENAPDYLDVIDNPMDMSTMMSKIDCHEYNTVHAFMEDIDLICSNALEYNPDRGPMDKAIRHRACALKDTAYAIIKTELDKDFEKTCVDIEQSRKRRGVKSTTVPNFYRTKPVTQNGEPASSKSILPSYLDNNRPARSIPKPDGERFSRRVRGINIDPTPSLEVVEKTARNSQTTLSSVKNISNEKLEKGPVHQVDNEDIANKSLSQEELLEDGADLGQDTENELNTSQIGSQTDPSHKRSRTSKCVWCRPKRRRKNRGLKKQMIACKKRLMLKRPPAVFKSDKKISSAKSSPTMLSVNQPLKVDIDAGNSAESEMKSPIRKSTRLVSPSIITTRRQSHSPSARPTTSTQPMEMTVDDLSQEETTMKDNNCGDKEETLTTVDKEERTASSDSVEMVEKSQDESIPQDMPPEGRKLAVVKSLDVEFMAADSGAGSSLDGNGDSRDSMDTNKLVEPLTTNSSHNTGDFNENNRQNGNCIASTVEGSSKTLVVPIERLSELLDRLVLASDGFTVERLEKIYSQLSQIIFKHRQSYDRSMMVNELEEKVSSLTKQSNRQSWDSI